MVEAEQPSHKKKQRRSHEAVWDSHGIYQWTYFDERVKRHISYFLSQRLHGKNLDIGGGWYLSHPGSTVIDISSQCLSYNKAKDKVKFDLDDLGKGLNLPIRDNAFDSATLVSVWQYLHHPDAVLSELERVIVPGGELYIINGQGAGLPELKSGSGSHTETVQSFFDQKGYDSLIEHIPTHQGDTKEFQSLCVGLPQTNVLGEVTSIMKNKTQRQQQDADIVTNPETFIDDFILAELRTNAGKLSKLSPYPVTVYSQDYKRKVKEFCAQYRQMIGTDPIITFDGNKPELDMITEDSRRPLLNLLITDRVEQGTDQLVYELKTFYDLAFNSYHSSTLKDIYQGRYVDLDDSALYTLVDLMNSTGFTQATKDLQERIRAMVTQAGKRGQRQQQRYEESKSRFLVFEHKQRSSIDTLIEQKQKILSGKVPIVDTVSLDIPSIIRSLEGYYTRERERLRQERVSRRSETDIYDIYLDE
jgi:hypothetical protein